MKIFLACPAPPRSLKGNRVTAARWANFLKELGHRVRIGKDWDDGDDDLLIALHARKSHASVRRFRRAFPARPIIVALTGTDLYHDLPRSARARRSLDLADRLVVLQPRALDELTAPQRRKARVITQSASPLPLAPSQRLGWPPDCFPVVILGHLRHEKDPFRTAMALKLLPRDTRVWVIHLGEALSPAMERRARRLTAQLPRYQWLGELSAAQARLYLASSRLMVISSRLEGGANVVSEAIAQGVPILASRIPGNLGLLGARYPGTFPVGDTAALARLLARAEQEGTFYERLKSWCVGLAPMVEPARERAAWEALLAELMP